MPVHNISASLKHILMGCKTSLARSLYLAAQPGAKMPCLILCSGPPPFIQRLMNGKLAADVGQSDWIIRVYPVDVGCREFVGKTTARQVQVQLQAIKALSNTAEQTSRWLWIKRRDITCAPKQQKQSRGSQSREGHIWKPPGGDAGLSLKQR